MKLTIGYQVRYWTGAGTVVGGSIWVNDPNELGSRIQEILTDKIIRIEIVQDDLRGNVSVGANGVNGPGWRT